ncbi:hypothetical protein FUAX_03380 [Fulvitalea axinellae]|uniref:HTH-type transcriptional regulator MgrA n=1 Tax=Fulvitalea axinellae TaxID=1182444 RepID=A0AAU9CGM0_9BACT|nr:hypothetical protein FUAX_03380 [Fulvitalea axinellae]
MKIEDEIKHEFSTPQERAATNVVFTANWILTEVAMRLKPSGLSWQQLNILSILKGQPKGRATVNLIKERMVDRMPNVSRLLNKMAEKGLVTKQRDTQDQRVVFVSLTETGDASREKAREALASKSLISLDDKRADQLNGLLEELRE